MYSENSLTAADVAAVTRNNDSGIFGNDWAWIVILLLFGYGGRGFGGFGGGGYGEPCATQSDVRAAVDQQTLISKLDQQTYGLADATYALNNAITAGFNGLSREICDCCCTTQRAIDSVKYENATNACAIQNTIQNTTRDIIDNANANSRAILDFLTQDKIAALTAENQTLKFAASQTAQNAFIAANQEAQTAELIRRLGRDCPVPAYVVPNPNCCYQYGANPAGNFGCSGF